MSKTRMGKRIASLLLSLVMMLSLLPTTVYAAMGTADDNGVTVVESTAPDAAQEEGVDNAVADEGEDGDANVIEGEDGDAANAGEGEDGSVNVTEGEGENSALTTQSGDAETPVAYTEGETETVVAKIDDTEYATLAEAINAAGEGATIQVLADATLDADLMKGNITIEGVVTDDGVKPTITGKVWLKGANVTLKDLDLVWEDNHILSINGANSTLENCTISGAVKKNIYVARISAANVTLKGCVFEGQVGEEQQPWLLAINSNDATITGCTFRNAYMAIYQMTNASGTATMDTCTFENVEWGFGGEDSTTGISYEIKNSQLTGSAHFYSKAAVAFDTCSFAGTVDNITTESDISFTNCTFTEDYLGKVYVANEAADGKVVALNNCQIVDANGAGVTDKSAYEVAISKNFPFDAHIIAVNAGTDNNGEFTSGTFYTGEYCRPDYQSGGVHLFTTLVASGYEAALEGSTQYTRVVNEKTQTAYYDKYTVAPAVKPINNETKLATALANGGSVKLGGNITLTKSLTVSTTVTLDLAGKTITGALAIGTNGNLTINDSVGGGKITSTGTTITANGGTLTLDGGTIESTSASTYSWAINISTSSKAIVTINSGTVKADKDNAIRLSTNSDATLTVAGGTIQSNQASAIYQFGSGTVEITNGRIIGGGGNQAVYATSYAGKIVTITGGTLEGGVYYKDNSPTGKLTIGTPNGAASDVVLSDVNLDSYSVLIYLYSGTVQKFENWKNMTVSAVGMDGAFLTTTDISTQLPNNLKCVKDSDSDTYFYVKDTTVTNAAAVITRGSEEIPYNTVEQAVKALADGDTLTLNVDYTGTIAVQEKNITIDLGGHTVTATGLQDNAVNIAQSATESNTVTVKNGHLVAKDQSASAIHAIMNDATSETLTLALEDVTLELSHSSAKQSLVRLGNGARTSIANKDYVTNGGLQVVESDGTWIYGTANTAFTHANGSTVTLLNDWFIDSINNSNGAVYVPDNATYAKAELELDNHTINYVAGLAAIRMGNADNPSEGTNTKSLTVKNGTINAKGGYGAAVCGSNKTLILDGVTLTTTGTDKPGIYTNGMTTGNTVTLTNSSIAAENCTGIYFPGAGTLTVENTNVTGSLSGIEIRAGELHVSGDSAITSTATEFAFTNNDNGSTTTGAAIAAVKHTVGNDLTVNISGGTMQGVKALYQHDPNADKTGTVTMKVTGGTFTGAVTAVTETKFISGGTFSEGVDAKYVADGYVYDTTDNAVKADTSVAAIGDTKYATLKEAIDAANTGDTITLLDDVDLKTSSQTLYSNLTDKKDVHNLTFDLNGHKITSSSTSYTVSASREGLVIKNGTIENTASKTTYGAIYATFSTKGTHTLTLENVTVIAKNTGIYATTTNGDATVTIGDKTVIEAETGIKVVGANATDRVGTLTLNVSAGTVTGTKCGIHVTGPTNKNETAAVTVNITGGEVSSVTTETGSNKRGANVTISGGTVTGALKNVGKDVITITGGDFKGTLNNGSAGTISISGGTFSSEPDATYLAEGYTVTKNADGTYSVTKATVYVAEVGTVKYESLQAAIDAASAGATVTLIADTRENVTVSKKLTLDLNGYTLNGGTVANKPALKVDNASVTVKDSSENKTGTIMREDTAENSGKGSHYVIDIQGKNGFLKFEGGIVKNDSGNTDGKGASLIRLGDDSNRNANPTLTITGGTFTQDNFIAIKVDYGTLHLLGGTVNSANSYAIENWRSANIKGGTVNGTVSTWVYSGGVEYSELNITDGTVNGDVISANVGSAADKQARVYVKGGTVNGTLGTFVYDTVNKELTGTTDAAKATIEVTSGTFSEDPTAYVVEASTVTANEDGTFGVEKAYLAKVGDTSYYTMDEAVKAQKTSGKDIVLLRDYTTNSIFYSGENSRTVDLNGHTWTYTGANMDSAAFEIDYSNTTLTVKNGAVVSSQLVGLIPYVKATGVSAAITYDNAGLVFEDVVMTANGHSGIETSGNNSDDTVTLKDSTLNVPNGYGIYFPSSGTLTIDTSTINAGTMGVQVCAGSLSINAGSQISVTDGPVTKTENDGAIEDGAAISIVNRTGYKGLGKIEVTGGTFTAKTGNAAIKAYNWENKTASAWANAGEYINVSGGTFSSAVKEEYCAAGYIPTENADGTFGVKEGKYVAVNARTQIKYESLQAAIDAAKSNQSVRLLEDITLTERVVVTDPTRSITLDLRGHSITAQGNALLNNGKLTIMSTGDASGTGKIVSETGYAVGVGSGSTLTISSGTLQGREGAVLTGASTGATITIKGGTFIATDNAVIAGNGSVREGDPNTITITGGIFTGRIESSGYIACGIYAPWKDNITVSGGTFNITNGAGIVARAGTVKVTGGTFNCTGRDEGFVGDSGNKVPCAALVFDKDANYPALTNDSKILVSGGSFSTDPAANGATLAEGYEATQTGGMYKVAHTPVAEVNGIQYPSLDKAIKAAAGNGGTVKLLVDINAPGTSYTIKNKVTIDLNGHNITGKGNNGVFYVYVTGDLTITGNGTITAVENSKFAMAVHVDSATATVTLKGGTYKQQITNTDDPQFDLIYAENGTVVVDGGTYEGATPDWTLNCLDKNYQAGTAHIIVNGGTFVGFDPRNNAAEGEKTSFVAPGVGVDANSDGTFTALPNMVAQVVDAEGNSVACYSSLGGALGVSAVKDGYTVRVLADTTVDSTLPVVTNNITIDGQGYTVTLDDSAQAQISVERNGKLRLSNVTIAGVANSAALLRITDSAEVTIDKDSRIIATSGDKEKSQPAIFIGKYKGESGTAPKLNIYGRVECNVNRAIAGNGTDSGTSYINIYDGAVVKSAKLAMFLPQPCKVNITGGTVEGYCAIGIKSGTLNITGGQVLGVVNDNELSDKNSVGSGMEYDGSAIVIDSHTGYKGNVNINISGSAFIQSRYSTGIREIGNEADKTNVTKLSISGGTVLSGGGKDAVQVRDVTTNNVSITGGSFSTDVTAYCAKDYQCNAPAEDEPLYTVTKKDAMVTVSRKLTLANNLIITYTAKMPTDYAEPYAEFNFWNNSLNEWQTSKVEGIATGTDADGNATYTFAFTGVNPQRMNDTLKMTLFAKTTGSTEFVAITKEYTDSVAAYCNAVINNSTYNVNGKWTEVLSNLVAYGAASQKYMKYNETALVTDSVLNCVTKDYTGTQEIAQVSSVSRKDGGITITSVGMVLSSSYAVRVFFTLNDNTSLSDVTFTANISGSSEQSFSKDDFTEQSYNGGTRYYFDYTGLNARQLDSEITFTATVSGTQDDTLGYSANTYLQYYINNPSANTVWNELVKWLFNYGWSCKNFK